MLKKKKGEKMSKSSTEMDQQQPPLPPCQQRRVMGYPQIYPGPQGPFPFGQKPPGYMGYYNPMGGYFPHQPMMGPNPTLQSSQKTYRQVTAQVSQMPDSQLSPSTTLPLTKEINRRATLGTPSSTTDVQDPSPASPRTGLQHLQSLLRDERANIQRERERIDALLTDNINKDTKIEELEGRLSEKSQDSSPEVQRLQSELDSYKQKLEELKTGIQSSPNKSGTHEPNEQANRYRSERDALEKGLTNAHNRFKNLQAELENAKKEISALNEKNLELETERAILGADFNGDEDLQTEISALKLEAEQQRKTIETLRVQNEELQNLNWESEELEALREARDALLAENRNLKEQKSDPKELETLQQQVEYLRNQLTRAMEENTELSQELKVIGETKAERSEKISANSNLETKIAELYAKIDQLSQENQELSKAKGKEQKRLEKALEEANAKIRKLADQIEFQQTTEIARLKQELKDQAAKFSQELSTAQNSLESAEFRTMEVEKSLEVILKRKQALFAEKQANAREITALNRERDELRKEAEDAERKYNDFLSLSGEDESALKKELRLKEQRLQQLKITVKECEAKRKELEQSLHKQYSEQIASLQDQAQELKAQKTELERELQSLLDSNNSPKKDVSLPSGLELSNHDSEEEEEIPVKKTPRKRRKIQS